MSENLPNIDDLFRKALDGYEDTPSEATWDNIDKNLDKKKVAFISRKYKKLKWVAAALFIFSAGMAMYTWHTKIRNKELVKQNALNKKKILRTPATSGINNEKDTAGKNLAAKINEQRPVINKTETKEGPSSDVAQTTAAPTGKPDESKLPGLGVASAKRAEKKTINLGGANDKQLAMKEKTALQPAGEKSTGLENEASSEKTKRAIEIATVREHETNKSMIEPPRLQPGKTVEIPAANDREVTASKTAAAANKSVRPFRGSKFSATIFYSPDFVSSRVDNDRHAYREDDRNEIKNKERISSSSSKGVLLSYSLGNKWSFQSGLTFSTMTTDIQPKTIFARPDNRGNVNYRFNCSAGYSYVTLKSGTGPAAGDSIMALSSQNTLRYVGVPFGITYNLFKGRFSLQPGAGLTANFLTSGKIETSLAGQSGTENKSINHIEGLSSSYVNGSISLAANYYFTKNLALNFTPVSRFALSAINKDAPVKTYLNSFGLGFGMTIKF